MIFNFAKNVKGANITKLEDAIIASQNEKFIILFAECIKDANTEKLKNVVAETKDENHFSSEERTFLVLMDLLKEQKFEDILNNKDKFSKLFIDEEESSKEEPKVFVRKNKKCEN